MLVLREMGSSVVTLAFNPQTREAEGGRGRQRSRTAKATKETLSLKSKIMIIK